jgi:hypothetical protein
MAIPTKNNSKKVISWILVVFVSVSCGALLSRINGISVVPTATKTANGLSDTHTTYVPSTRYVKGHEIVMVYIGSSTCGFANSPEMPEVIERIKLALQMKSLARESAFSAIGVSIDWDVSDGIGHLAKFGTFDEIMTGRKWQGHGGRQFFWDALPSSIRSTPQVLVIERMADSPSLEPRNQGYQISNETILTRKTGAKAISDWLERGTPLPRYAISP